MIKYGKPDLPRLEKALTNAAEQTGTFRADPKEERVREVKAEIDEISKPGAKKGVLNVRVDQDIIDWLRAGGSGWQSALNKALRALMEAQRP